MKNSENIGSKKFLKHLGLLCAAVVLMPGIHSSASAATYYWDNNGSTLGFGTASGSWAAPTVGSGTEGWSTSPTGVLLPGTVTTATGDILNFGTNVSGLSAGTIAVSSVAAKILNFGSASGSVVLSGGTIAMGVNAGTITVNNASDTINSAITGSLGLTKAGSGILNLGGANTFTGGIFLNGGTLALNRDTGSISSQAVTGYKGRFLVTNSNASGTQGTTIGNLTIGSSSVRSGAVTIEVNETGAGLATVTTGAINTTPGSGATVNYVTTGGATIVGGSAGTSFTNNIDSHQFFNGGDYAFVGTGTTIRGIDYGTDTNTFILTPSSGNITNLAGRHYLMTATNTTASQGQANFGTVKIQGSGQINFISTGSGSNSINGFLRTGGGATTITGGTIAYRATTGANTDIVIRTDTINDSILFGSSISAANSTGAPTHLTKTGQGLLTLSGTNNFLGNFNIGEGTVMVTNDRGLGFGGTTATTTYVAGTTTVNSGATLDLNSASGARTINEPIVLSGASLINSSATNASTIESGVAAIVMTSVGTGYTSSPTVSVAAGSGSGAAVTGALSGSVAGASVTTGGTGYTSDFALAFSGGGGSGAAGTAVVSSVALDGTENAIGGAGTLNIKAIVKDSTTAGGFTKTGAGTLTLSGANTYTGGTRVNGGTLTAANNSALGTGAVVVSTGGTLLISSGTAIANSVTLAGGSYNRNFAMSDAYAFAATSSLGGIDTNGMVRDGEASSPASLATSFSLAPASAVSNDANRVSDVLAFTGTGTDTFVLQLSTASLPAGSILAWNNAGTWVNAVAGNTGSGGLAGAYATTYDAFVLANGGFNAGTMLGAYGFDGTGTVWAVINHNSEFAALAVPEPSTYALLGMGIGALWFLRRRKKTSV